MKRIEALFDDYSAYHRTAGNKMCHRIGIPLIVFSLVGLLQHFRLGAVGGLPIDAAICLITLSTIYYLVLDVPLAVIMLVVSALFYALALHLSLPIHAVLFVIGWILQFIGHGAFEKQRPAFLKNFIHLLIGPLWIVNDAFHVVGDKPAS